MIKVIRYDEKPITLIGECVGQCYGSDTSDPVKNYKRGFSCIKDGHGRVEEYPDVILEIDGYSIKAVRDVYTHIIGTTRTQESTRYVNMTTRGYVTPLSIMKDVDAWYLYSDLMIAIFTSYDALVKAGIPKEDASCVLPLGMKTKFVLKINVRALLHLGEVRLCGRAYHEVRDMVKEIKRTVGALDDEWKKIADMMRPKCEVIGYCTESQSCGRMPKKKDVIGE